jgi:imidazolonepropionase
MTQPHTDHPDAEPHWDRVWINAQLATMDGADLGVLKNAVLGIRDGRIAWIGPRKALDQVRWSADIVSDATGSWITPGLIECHTHLIYSGDRSTEFESRLAGASYEQIARNGGGILSTMRATRAATEEQLLQESLPRAQAFVREGVTTLEVKSGYGLDLVTERKMLRVGRRLGEMLGINVINTFLGAHALPPEYAGRRDAYADLVVDQMLPAFAEEHLIDAVDAFHESIAFNDAQTARIFERARQLNLPLRLHADQLNDNGGGALAARFTAASADHLEFVSEDSLQQMTRAGTVAGLLPIAFYYLRENQHPPVHRLRQLGVPMMVSSDCNPGTAPFASLHLAMNMACVLFGLTPVEAWLGVTQHAARALSVEHERGTLRVGSCADLALWSFADPVQICASFGMHRPTEVIVGGEPIGV